MTEPTTMPLPLTDEERPFIRISVERMTGGLVLLDELVKAFKFRLENYEARARMKIGNADEMLYRRAELADVIDGLLKRGAQISAQARGSVAKYPGVFGGAPHVEQPSVSETETNRPTLTHPTVYVNEQHVEHPAVSGAEVST